MEYIQKFLKEIVIVVLSLSTINVYAITSLKNNNQIEIYKQDLNKSMNHKFDDNQIRSFVYYWYGLHDKHEPIERSIELLNTTNLSMIYPETTVKNIDDYHRWYDNVGKNIRSNIHTIKELKITFLTNHKYKIDIIVNWQAIDKDNKFINVDATQQWIVADGTSNMHPYIEKYNVLKFTTIK